MLRATFLIIAMAALLAGPAAAASSTACQPTAAHPYPVILVHGTFANQALSWNALRPLLEADGFCVFASTTAPTRPPRWRSPATRSPPSRVRSWPQTGAAKVSFVGHSQGGSLSRYVAKDKGLLAQTDDIVGLAPSSHGTDQPVRRPRGAPRLRGVPRPAQAPPSCRRSTRRPRRRARSSYTVVSTRYDEVVTPYQSQALAGDA